MMSGGISPASTVHRLAYLRSWLDSTEAPIGVQQKLRRHAQVSTTMNVYGNALMTAKREANSKVVKMIEERPALNERTLQPIREPRRFWRPLGLKTRPNRDSRVEPVPKLMTDGWIVEAKRLKNCRVAETK